MARQRTPDTPQRRDCFAVSTGVAMEENTLLLPRMARNRNSCSGRMGFHSEGGSCIRAWASRSDSSRTAAKHGALHQVRAVEEPCQLTHVPGCVERLPGPHPVEEPEPSPEQHAAKLWEASVEQVERLSALDGRVLQDIPSIIGMELLHPAEVEVGGFGRGSAPVVQQVETHPQPITHGER